jgi:hypothetical protein
MPPRMPPTSRDRSGVPRARERDIGHARRLEAHPRATRAVSCLTKPARELAKPLFRGRAEERRAIAKVIVAGLRRDADPARHCAERELGRPLARDDGERGVEQRPPELAVMILPGWLVTDARRETRPRRHRDGVSREARNPTRGRRRTQEESFRRGTLGPPDRCNQARPRGSGYAERYDVVSEEEDVGAMRFVFSIKTKNGGVVTNIQIDARSQAEAEEKIKRENPSCTITKVEKK